MNKKVNSEHLNSLINAAAKSAGADADVMKSAVESGDLNGLLGAIRPEDSEKVQKILSDKGAVKNLLSTPEAQEIMKKLMGGK